MKKEYDYDNLPDFITKDELNELLPKALEEFKAFVRGEGYEEEYFEMWAGGKVFDLNVWDEEGSDRSGRCSAALYPTTETIRDDTGGEWRETDSSRWVTLFSWSK
jgi:hypothetical protein|tara:strand:+ start:2666 stop:2980 length:315 start_codon:yes stop_codon:yes gene_type:complete